MFEFIKKLTKPAKTTEGLVMDFVCTNTAEDTDKLAVAEERTKQQAIRLAVAHKVVAGKRLDVQRQSLKVLEKGIQKGLFRDGDSKELLRLCADSLARSSSPKEAARTFARWSSR